MKLGLGTVQFGLEYGISNSDGKTTEAEADRIVTTAADLGISVIDTAALYGNSEEMLGNILPRTPLFKIVTKTLRVDASEFTLADIDRVENGFRASLERLRLPSVYGLLVHNADDLLVKGSERLTEWLYGLKYCGLVQKIGVSVYGVEKVEALLDRFAFDLVQAPVNVFDQRLIASGILSELKLRGIEVHARSAFLQGLLLMPLAEIPPHFASIRLHLAGFHDFTAKLGLTTLEAALGFLEAQDNIDVIVCGVNSRQQLLELGAAAKPLSGIDFSRFALSDEDMLNPSRWRIL